MSVDEARKQAATCSNDLAATAMPVPEHPEMTACALRIPGAL
jgi:hypothetical protein